MFNQILQLVKCQHCYRLIDHRKLSLHEMMCSTLHLRLSQSFAMEKVEPKKKCQFCLGMIEGKDFDFHLKLECRHRLVPCIDCDDQFPLSLFNQHMEVCRGRKTVEIEEEEQGGFFDFVSGLKEVGNAIYNKGVQAAVYCGQVIQQTRAPTLLYLQSIRLKIEDTFQDLFMSLAYEQNVEGMPRQQIRRIEMSNYKKMCTICICEIQDQEVIKRLKCKHIYHPSCIDKWLRINRTCPLCKMDQME